MRGLNGVYENGDYLKDWPTNNKLKRLIKDVRLRIGKSKEDSFFKDCKNIKEKIVDITNKEIIEVPDIKVSIVIPAYNAEKHISEAVECCQKQTHSNIEIIVVDDGSKDDTLKILNSISENRLKIISQPNGGPGIARNTGIKSSSGKYIYFLDADDYIPTYSIEAMLLVCVNLNVDFAVGKTLRNHLDVDHMRYFWMPKNYTKFRVSNLNKEINLFKDTNIHNRMYSKSFWDENKFTFENCLYEDKLLSLDIWRAAQNVGIINNFTYQWSVRGEDSSITNIFKLDNLLSRIDVINKNLDKNMDNELRKEYEKFTIEQDLTIALKYWKQSSQAERKIIFEEFSKVISRFKHPILGNELFNALLNDDFEKFFELVKNN